MAMRLDGSLKGGVEYPSRFHAACKCICTPVQASRCGHPFAYAAAMEFEIDISIYTAKGWLRRGWYQSVPCRYRL